MVTKTYLKPTYLPTYATVLTVVTVVTAVKVMTVVTVETKKNFFSPNNVFHQKSDKTQKLKIWQIESTKCEEEKNKNKKWNVTKLKKSKCDTYQKLKIWQNSKCEKLKNSKCDKTEINQNVKNIKKLDMWQNSQTLNVTKL